MVHEEAGGTGSNAPIVDVLMITFNAPGYIRLSIPRLLESCDDRTRIWLWHNGTDEETLEVARQYASDPRVHRFHHSVENVRLTEPTNWLWTESDGGLVGKVDDDCLVPTDWINRLRAAHSGSEDFGALGASCLRPEDQDQELLAKKVESFGSDVQLFRNHWVQGSGYLLARRWIERHGVLADGQSWTAYCLDIARHGAINGFVWPLLFQDHMDDPRSTHTLLRSDEDLEWRMPLSLGRSKIRTLDDWEERMRRSAREVQKAPVDLRYWTGWRWKAHNLRSRISQLRRP